MKPIRTTGFAAPTQGYEEQGIDLNHVLIKNHAATFFFRLDNPDLDGLGLPNGSLLIVDRSIKPAHDQLVVIAHSGEFLCRKMLKNHNGIHFTNGKEQFFPIENDTEIIGVVTASIKTYGYNPYK